MERIKYQELINFLEGNVLDEWDKSKIKQLEKESRIQKETSNKIDKWVKLGKKEEWLHFKI